VATIFSANAGILTVSNNTNSPGQYSDIESAVTAANSGDTLLVAGSPTSYGSVSINKEIHIIGVGYKPNKDLPMFTEFSSVTFTYQGSGTIVSPYSNASRSSIKGCEVSNFYITGRSESIITNILIERNYFNSGLYISGYCNGVLAFNNNIYSSSTSGTNCIIANNIFRSSANSDASSSQTIIKNNLFLGNGTTYAHSDLDYAVVSNNIYYGSSPAKQYSYSHEYTTFTNNLSYSSINDTTSSTGTNSSSGNLVGVAPNFVSESDFSFNDTDDFNLAPSSPAINAGSDGTDIGIYGGTYPWPEGGSSGSGFMYSQEPQIPQVNQMNIVNPSVPSNGNINVQIKGIINQ
jgi:hypothetical protein